MGFVKNSKILYLTVKVDPCVWRVQGVVILHFLLEVGSGGCQSAVAVTYALRAI